MLSTRLHNFIKRHGMNIPEWNNRWVWAIGLTIFSVLTITEFVPLIQDYKTNNLATQITFEHTNDVKQPQVALCIPWASMYLEEIAQHLERISKNETSTCDICKKLTKQSWDVWNEVDFENTSKKYDYHKALAIHLMKKLLITSDKNFTTLSNKYNKWNQPLIDAARDFFECVNIFDKRMNKIKENETRTWCNEEKIVDSYLADKEIIDRLFSRLVDVLCDDVHFENSKHVRLTKDYCIEILKRGPSVTHDDKFCFQLPLTDETNSSNVFVKSDDKYVDKPFVLYSDADSVYWVPEDSKNTYTTYVSRNIRELVDVKYEVVLTVKEGRQAQGLRCYNQSSETVCKSSCLTETVTKKCKCVPYSFRNNNERITKILLPYCNTSFYTSCDFDQDKEIQNCGKQCENPCQYVQYLWHVTSYPINRRGFNLSINPIAATFVEFSLEKKTSRSQFFSQVGAIFNFYLGFSGPTVIGLVIFFGKLFKRWYLSKKKNGYRVSVIATDNAMHVKENNLYQLSDIKVLGFANVESANSQIKMMQEAMEYKYDELERKMEANLKELKDAVLQALGQTEVREQRNDAIEMRKLFKNAKSKSTN